MQITIYQKSSAIKKHRLLLTLPPMNENKQIEATEEECKALLDYIFDGYEKFLQVIAPSGWVHSPHKYFFHPTAEQQFEEYKRFSENINSFASKRGGVEKTAEKSLADFKGDDDTE